MEKVKSLKTSIFLPVLAIFMCLSCEQEQSPEFKGYDIPFIYESQILTKETTLINILSDVKDYSSFLFFSDAHWEINKRHSPEIIRHITDSTGIDKVFFGGDAISGSPNKKQSFDDGMDFSKAFSFIHNFFPIVGNHDSNNGYENATFSDDEVFKYMHSSLINNSKVHYGDYFHYYVDDEDEKTRYICLDNGLLSPSSTTLTFLCNALVEIPDNWHIIIFTHIIFDAEDYYNPNTIYLSSVGEKFIEIADAYNGHQKYSFKDGVEYNFDQAKSRIEFIMGGHIHRDYISYSKQSIPLIALDSDCTLSYSKYSNYVGIVYEQCITAVIADYDKNQLYLIRFGRGEDIIIPIK